MKIDANDPKWTAYALDEITDERERIEMESILRQSPEIAAIVEEIHETAVWLKEELTTEPAELLMPEQRERIEAKAAKASSGGFFSGLFGGKPAWGYAFAAAAVIIIALFAVRPFRQTDISSMEPALIAEVSENLLRTHAVEAIRSAGPEPPSVAHDTPPIPLSDKVASVEKPEAPLIQQAIVNDSMQVVAPKAILEELPPQFVAPEAIPREIPPPQMDAPDLFAANIPVSTGISTAIREADMDVTRLMPSIATATSPTTPPPPVVLAKRAPPRIAADIGSGVGISVADAGAVERLRTFELQSEMIARSIVVDKETNQTPNWRAGGPFNTETYDSTSDNPFLDVTQNPLSTFSIDVDTASYSNMRRFLNNGRLPPKDSIRIEELINYFDYDYSAPRNDKPFAVNAEMTEAPWNPQHRLLRIGIKGREIAEGKRPDSNLVFLIDVSGSMSSANRLPLVKESMKMFVDKLTKSDRVAIVIYAGDTRILLPSTRGDQKTTLRNAIDGLRASGSTNGASGIQLAYQTAQENFIKGGVNRVILATDGDFNVGVTNRGDLTRLIEEKAKSGIFLSALGFGMDNYKDATLEMLADKGRGNYAYIDTENEARKVLVEQMNSTLVAIAQDVKIQVEFNPMRVNSYRLLGYENRVMAKEDFNDDTKMAGVLGAGHAVTAFYELVLAGESEVKSDAKPGVDPLRYQSPPQTSAAANSLELATVKIRSKKPEKEESELTEYVVNDIVGRFSSASGDFKFAASVAAFGMMLRDSTHKGDVNFERILEWARAGAGEDRNGYREEFIRLVHRAASMK